jgi:hypothetical protein
VIRGARKAAYILHDRDIEFVAGDSGQNPHWSQTRTVSFSIAVFATDVVVQTHMN